MSTLIEITGAPESRKGTSANNRPYEIITQEGYKHVSGQKYPDKCQVNIEDIGQAYKLGFYEIDYDTSIEIEQYGGLSFIRYINLKPSSAPAPKVG